MLSVDKWLAKEYGRNIVMGLEREVRALISMYPKQSNDVFVATSIFRE